MKHILQNWKTSSLGITMIAGAVVSLFFVPVSQASIMAAVTGILGGLGFLFAGDSSNSVQSGDSTTITPPVPPTAEENVINLKK
jgi:hypothetical protein